MFTKLHMGLVVRVKKKSVVNFPLQNTNLVSVQNCPNFAGLTGLKNFTNSDILNYKPYVHVLCHQLMMINVNKT